MQKEIKNILIHKNFNRPCCRFVTKALRLRNLFPRDLSVVNCMNPIWKQINGSFNSVRLCLKLKEFLKSRTLSSKRANMVTKYAVAFLIFVAIETSVVFGLSRKLFRYDGNFIGFFATRSINFNV